MTRMVFLAARTARSQAYAQAMARTGIRPEAVILFGPEGGARMFGQAAGQVESANAGPVPLPDLAIPLETTCAAWPTETIVAGSVNDPRILERVRALAPELVIFSGFGGELVGKALLEVAPHIHAHSGWLPDYRGSTTLYYSWLERGDCGVSVFLLDATIDTGPILLRKRYPAPPVGVEVDYCYDSAIRADAMVAALARWGEPPEAQDSAEGTTFYVIHPVLKHLALLQREP